VKGVDNRAAEKREFFEVVVCDSGWDLGIQHTNRGWLRYVSFPSVSFRF